MASVGRDKPIVPERKPVKLFKFRVQEKTELCVPEKEVLEEIPNDLDDKWFMPVDTQNGVRYVRRGRMFQVEYFDRFQGPLYEEANERSDNPKAIKQLKDTHKEEIEMYKSGRENAEKRAKMAEKDRDRYFEEKKLLQKEVQKWQSAYEKLRERAVRQEYESDREYHLRILTQNNAKEECERMANKVLKMQSGLEEVRIAEADLAGDFKQLCYKVSGCINHLKHRVSEGKQEKIEELRSQLDFNTEVTIELSFFDNALACYLLYHIVRQVEKNFMLGLAEWSTATTGGESPSVTALMEVERDMNKRVAALGQQTQESMVRKKQQPKQKKADDAARENIQEIQTYYRWRADTTRLHDMLDKQYAGVRRSLEDSVAEITESVCAMYLGFILQQPEDQDPFEPWVLFQHEGIDGEQAEAQFDKFRHKVKGCVEQAMRLYSRMRMGKANYRFEAKANCAFDPSEMEIKSDQLDALPEKSRYRTCDLKAAYCVFPAFVKYGDDYGQDYHQKRILRHAEVIVEGLPAVPQGGDVNGRSSPPADTDGMSLPSTPPNPQGNGEAERNDDKNEERIIAAVQGEQDPSTSRSWTARFGF